MFQSGKVGHFNIQDPVEKLDKYTNTKLLRKILDFGFKINMSLLKQIYL